METYVSLSNRYMHYSILILAYPNINSHGAPRKIAQQKNTRNQYELRTRKYVLKSVRIVRKIKRKKWYFVTKIVLTYCEKKLF